MRHHVTADRLLHTAASRMGFARDGGGSEARAQTVADPVHVAACTLRVPAGLQFRPPWAAARQAMTRSCLSIVALSTR